MNDEPLILVLYVDDLFLTGNEKFIIWYKKKLASEFEMKDLLNLYHKVVNDDPLILVLYVDDLLYGVRRNSPLSSE